MFIYNQEGKKEHIVIESGRTILAAQIVMKSTHKATLSSANQAGRVWVYGIPRDHGKKNVTLIDGEPLNIAGDEAVVDPKLTPLEPIVTVIPMDFTSREYIGLIIEIKDSEFVKSISDVHLTFTQMPLVEPGINNLDKDYTIIFRDADGSSDVANNIDVDDGSILALPNLSDKLSGGFTYAAFDGWTANGIAVANRDVYNRSTMGTTFLSVWKINLKFDFATDASYSYIINNVLTTNLTFVQVLQAIAAKYSAKPFSVTIDGIEYLSVTSIEPLKDFGDIPNISKVGKMDGVAMENVISMFYTKETTMANITFVPTVTNVTASNVGTGTFKVSESSIQSICATLSILAAVET